MENKKKLRPLKTIEEKESGTRTMKGDGAKGWFFIFVMCVGRKERKRMKQ